MRVRSPCITYINKPRLFQNSNKQVSDYNNRRANRFLNSSLISSPIHNEDKNKNNKNHRNSPQIQINKINSKKIDTNNSNRNSIKLLNTKSRYVKMTLFPYKYYLCSIFIKNIDITKKSIFFTKKFISVYNFICQLFDISSYLILQREFEIMKNTIMVGKDKDILENRQKINVNDQSFNIKMKECLDTQKLSILGRIKHSKSKNY